MNSLARKALVGIGLLVGFVFFLVVLGLSLSLAAAKAGSASVQDDIDAAALTAESLTSQMACADMSNCECPTNCTTYSCPSCDGELIKAGAQLETTDASYRVISTGKSLYCPVSTEIVTDEATALFAIPDADAALDYCLPACDADDSCTHVVVFLNGGGCFLHAGCDESERYSQSSDTLMMEKL